MTQEERQASSYLLATVEHGERVVLQARFVQQKYRLRSHELVEQEVEYTGFLHHILIPAPVLEQEDAPATCAGRSCARRIAPTQDCVAKIRDSAAQCYRNQIQQAV